MSNATNEAEWKARYKARLLECGVIQALAQTLTEAADVDLDAIPETCAEEEIDYCADNQA